MKKARPQTVVPWNELYKITAILQEGGYFTFNVKATKSIAVKRTTQIMYLTMRLIFFVRFVIAITSFSESDATACENTVKKSYP